MGIKLYAYKMGSESAKDLASLLGGRRVRDIGRYSPKRNDVIISWGNGKLPSWYNSNLRILNNPKNVAIASNKLSTFRALQQAGVLTPEFTTDINVANQWLNAGDTIIERHTLRGRSGEGIRVVALNNDNDPDSIVETRLQSAPLYTKFVAKTAEFRVHVFNGKIIDYVQKKKVLSENRDETFNPYVSSMEQGWVFSRTEILEMPGAKTVAIAAVRALGLDFGAVDIMYLKGKFYVLEINTAPGLAGTTLVNYGNAIRRYMGLADLPAHITASILNDAPARPIAPIVASVNRRPSLRNQIDRQLRTGASEIALRFNSNLAQRIRSLLLDM